MMNVLWLQSGGCGGCSMSLLNGRIGRHAREEAVDNHLQDFIDNLPLIVFVLFVMSLFGGLTGPLGWQ